MKSVQRTTAVILLLAIVSTYPALVVQVGFATPAQTTEESKNSTIPQQKNPAEVERANDIPALKANLKQQLSSRVEASTTKLSRGDYNGSRQAVDREYVRNLERFQRLAEVTSGDRDDRTVDRFQEIRREHLEYVDRVERYERTQSAYREARTNGDEARARELARELERIAEDVNRSGSNLTADYDRSRVVTNTTSPETVREVSSNIEAEQSEIRESTFVETRLTASADDARIAFVEPMSIVGRLRTENGTAVENEPIEISVRNHSYRTRTDESGRFTVTYRPTTLPLDADVVSVQYVPSNASDYLGSKATVRVDPRQVVGSVSVTDYPTTSAFGDSFSVTGSVTVDDTGAGAVPVVVRIDGTSVARTYTGPDGAFSVSRPFPSDVSDGRQSLTVTPAVSNRVVKADPVTESIDVTETESRLTADVQRSGEVLKVSGRLTTVEGEPVGGETVKILVNGISETAAETGPDGRYRISLRVPQGTFEVRNIATVEALFEGDGTNIERASEVRTISNPDAQSGEQPGPFEFGPLVAAIQSLALLSVQTIVVAVAVAIVLSTLYYRQSQDGETLRKDGVSDDETGRGGRESPKRVLESARELLEDGNRTAAVVTVYAAVRRELLSQASPTDPMRTHWEFFASCQGGGLPEKQLDALRELTQLYEVAIFSSGELSPETAETALQAGTQILGDSSLSTT